jgi:hypothetical protein
MKFLLPLLEKRSGAITFVLAALVALLLATQMVSSRVTPYTDGNHYVQRAFALYGFLHTGQGGKFAELFTLPRQTLLPPQYPLFFLVPSAWAGLAAYGAIQLLVNFGVLAAAVWNLCRVFERRAWAPAMFLLCACENYAFDYPYFFFLDLTFAAFGALALSFQVEAWRRPSPRASLLAGGAVGLLFWIKPANAVIFTAIFVLCEAIRAAWPFLTRSRMEKVRFTLGHPGALLAGFLPLVLAATICGAWQTIFSLIQGNELSQEWETHLQAGFLRVFYFPLCFAYFYDAVVLLILAAILLFAAHFLRRDEAEPISAPVAAFPGRALIVLAIGYAIFGEFFSFWVLVKTMRALVFMLPVLWLLLFRLAERARIRADWLLLGALAYGAVLTDQVTTDSFHSKPLSPDKFLLADEWYDYLPMAWPRYGSGYGVVSHLREILQAQLPQGGRIGVTTERVFLDGRSLALQLNGAALLDGRAPRYSCVRLFDVNGRYSPNAFLTANALLIYVARNAQYSQFTWREDTGLLAYVPDHWAAPETIRQVSNPEGRLLGYLVPLPQPLTAAQLADGMKACGAPGPMPDDRLDEYIYGRPFTWPECLEILRQWAAKRFG